MSSVTPASPGNAPHRLACLHVHARYGRQGADRCTKNRLTALLPMLWTIRDPRFTVLLGMHQGCTNSPASSENLGTLAPVRWPVKLPGAPDIWALCPATSSCPSRHLHEPLSMYASLVTYYSVFSLKQLDEGAVHLYLLCFVYHRYQKPP